MHWLDPLKYGEQNRSSSSFLWTECWSSQIALELHVMHHREKYFDWINEKKSFSFFSWKKAPRLLCPIIYPFFLQDLLPVGSKALVSDLCSQPSMRVMRETLGFLAEKLGWAVYGYRGVNPLDLISDISWKKRFYFFGQQNEMNYKMNLTTVHRHARLGYEYHLLKF